MEAKAVSRYVRVSPRKARIVLNQIRGKNVIAALETLRFTNRAVAEVVEFCNCKRRPEGVFQPRQLGC